MKKVVAGMDLHSNNVVVGIVDSDGKRLAHRKLPCELDAVIKFLKPYKKQLEEVAVESTFNWYWLVDGLQAQGYPVVLANPAGMQQYHGLKHSDDTSDAFHIAELSRLRILPTGHIYDAELRPMRDLLRRRMMLVHHRTALMLSFKHLYICTTGQELTLTRLKGMAADEATALYEHPGNQLCAQIQLEQIAKLTEGIEKIEKVVLAGVRALPLYEKLTTLPGVGKILGMTITMEVGDINRFAEAGNFASYCRAVAALRLSNQKKKGENNTKCGNKYLAWAFVEAAQFARHSDAQCRQWFDRKAARTNSIVAAKALACKMAKAAWYVMHENTNYDPQRMLGQPKMKQ